MAEPGGNARKRFVNTRKAHDKRNRAMIARHKYHYHTTVTKGITKGSVMLNLKYFIMIFGIFYLFTLFTASLRREIEVFENLKDERDKIFDRSFAIKYKSMIDTYTGSKPIDQIWYIFCKSKFPLAFFFNDSYQ